MIRVAASFLAAALATVSGCSNDGSPREVARPDTSPTTGSVPVEGSPSGLVDDAELEVDGRVRRYRLVVPTSLDASTPAPLVIAMHGNGTDRISFADKSGLDAVAERHGFLLVYPDAAAEVGGVWNGGFSQRTRAVDDVAFLAALVDAIADRHSVDRNRVFATGLSGGGMMSYRLACENPQLVAAIAPVGATMVVDCDAAVPVSVLHVHGVDDRSIPIEGRDDRGFPPVADVVARWSELDGCEGEPERTTEGPATVTSWRGCDDGTAVRYYAVEGMGHEYGRVDQGAPVDVGELMWQFFSAHARAA